MSILSPTRIWPTFASFFLMTIVLLPQAGFASNINCLMPATSFSVTKAKGKLEMEITLRNDRQVPIALEQTTLLEGLMRFSATREQGGSLRHFSAQIAPGVTPIVILPGEVETRSYNLDESFPDLKSALKNGDVVLTWELELAPRGSDCSAHTTGTMKLHKLKSKVMDRTNQHSVGATD